MPFVGGVSPIRLPGGEWHMAAGGVPMSSAVQKAVFPGASADDLVALSIWADAVHRDGGIPRAAIPYLPGARQDRRAPGEALSAAVYARIINGCRLDRVVCLDPHSDVMPALLDRLVVVDLLAVVRNAIKAMPENLVGVVAPDAGATKRARRVAEELHLPLYQALKHRDGATGKLSRFTCEPLPERGSLLVVDDICDGGRTFAGLAEATGLPRERLALWVTHGVFSVGAVMLESRYSVVFTTNSHPGADAFRKAYATEDFLVVVADIVPLMYQALS